MSWYIPFDKLGPKQLEVLNGITKQLERPHWVQGFAGTGKTLVVTHLMERVAQLKPEASVCFITFTHALKDLVKSGLHGPVAKRVVIRTHTQYLSERRRYDYVFLDEVQDIRTADLTRIKNLASHLYVAGDTDQRIYKEGAREEEIKSEIQPITWKLLEIFRLTKLLQRVAHAVLPRTKLVEGLHAANTAEVTVRLVKHDTSQAESVWVWKEARRRARAGEPSVVLFPTHKAIGRFAREVAASLNLGEPPRRQGKDYDNFNEFWKQAGIDLMYFGNSYGDIVIADNRPYVFLMTFHSSKGLDFRNVFIPGMDANAVIVHSDALADDPELHRRLLFVAVTRSRENLFISYSGRGPHALLAGLPPEVLANVTPAQPVPGKHDEEEFF
jgi:superfamily I DNA/RNA helicase